MSAPKYCDENFKKIFLKYVEIGLLPSRAAVLSGVALSTFYGWETDKNREIEMGMTADNSRLLEFFQEVEKAKQENVKFHLENINKAAQKGNWTASAWVLERVHGQEFRKVDNINLENDSIKIVSSMPKHESEE